MASELKTIGVRLEPALLNLLREYADTYGRSMSSTSRLILRDYLRKWKTGDDRNASMKERVTS
jgi:hypothetical protein